MKEAGGKKINDSFIQEFFGIGDGEAGKAELEQIKEKLVRLRYENGADICVIDDEADGVYFLESGTAVVLDRDGAQVNIMHEGQYFGEYAVMTKQRRLTTVRSLGRTVVLRLSPEDFMDILSGHPDVWGDQMKRIYGQVSGKHSQILALSGMRKGLLQHPSNESPMSKRRMLIQYGILALIFILAALFVSKGSAAPVFILPLAFMLVYVLITKRTLESLILSCMLAALLIYRSGISASFVDGLLKTMEAPDNAFTVLVMALIGGVIQLIEASGAVPAFKKMVDSRVSSKRGVLLASYGIMAVTSIDDGLNMTCAASATNGVSKEQSLPREKTSLLYSMLPTVLSSFIPMSLWGIFFIGTVTVSVSENAVALFCRSIPFNFFSIITAVTMLLYCFGWLPLTKELKAADRRVREGGRLWPDGSEKYLSLNEPEMWGKIKNVMLPIAVLAVTSLAIRSILARSFVVDSAVGLTATLVFMFLLYCWQGLMTPEQFMEHLITGMASTLLPIALYLLSMCFSGLLEQLSLTEVFLETVALPVKAGSLFPAVIFLASTLLTMALGSSWAMYAIAIPIIARFAPMLGADLALCIGAVAGAGIAGEKNCMFTAEALNVGTVIGCSPEAVRRVRMRYSLPFTAICVVLYLIFGLIL